MKLGVLIAERKALRHAAGDTKETLEQHQIEIASGIDIKTKNLTPGRGSQRLEIHQAGDKADTPQHTLLLKEDRRNSSHEKKTGNE